MKYLSDDLRLLVEKSELWVYKAAKPDDKKVGDAYLWAALLLRIISIHRSYYRRFLRAGSYDFGRLNFRMGGGGYGLISVMKLHNVKNKNVQKY